MSGIIIYALIMVVGTWLGVKGVLKNKLLSKLPIIQEILILLLIFVMGVGIGKDENIMKYIFSLGVKAFVIAFFAVVFSIVIAHIYVKISRKFKGNK